MTIKEFLHKPSYIIAIENQKKELLYIKEMNKSVLTSELTEDMNDAIHFNTNFDAQLVAQDIVTDLEACEYANFKIHIITLE